MSWIKYVLVGVILVVILWFFLRTIPTDDSVPDYKELTNKIDSLNSELNLLKLERDSLLTIIDSSKVKVEVIEHWYEKELTDITNQSIASDVVFFTEYLSQADK